MGLPDDTIASCRGSELDVARLRAAVAHSLPPVYNFEMEKTIARLNEERVAAVCLQFPEGLLVWGEAIASLIEEFSETVKRVVVIGDVTYGACCVDDIKAVHLGCDFLVHYAHSCLVPIDAVNIKCLYVFVEIYLNPQRLARVVRECLLTPQLDDQLAPIEAASDAPTSPSESVPTPPTEGAAGAVTEGISKATTHGVTEDQCRIVMLGTIQFSKCVHQACSELTKEFGNRIFIPQCEPLTAGETLGCTSPVFPADCRVCVFVADGRFHVESAMIQNPHTRFYRYDPFTRHLIQEDYDHSLLFTLRNSVLWRVEHADIFVIVLSSLGRQGSVGLAEHARAQVIKYRPAATVVTIMLAELVPSTLESLLRTVSDPSRVCFVNVGCPRLALDWGHEFTEASFVTTYEVQQVLSSRIYTISSHPMDYFSSKGGDWSNYGRDGNRNGSIGTGPADKAAMRERLKRKWLQRKHQIAKHVDETCHAQNLNPSQ